MDTRNKQHRWLLHLLGAAILLLGLAACGSSEGPSEDEPNKPKPEAPVDDGDWQTVPATGGTIEKGDITITFPSGTFSKDTKVAITDVRKGETCGEYEVSKFYQITMPVKIDKSFTVSIKCTEQASDIRFAAKTLGYLKSTGENVVNIVCLDGSYSNGEYKLTLPATKRDEDDGCSYMTLGLVHTSSMDENVSARETRAPKIEGKVDNVEWYITNTLYLPIRLTSAQKSAVSIWKPKFNRYMAEAIKQIHALGFRITTSSPQIPIICYNDPDPKKESFGNYSSNDYYDAWSSIYINMGRIMSDGDDTTSIKQTFIHELLHYYQSYYGPSPKKTNTNEATMLCEAGSVWAEQFMDDGKLNNNFILEKLPWFIRSLYDIEGAWAGDNAEKTTKERYTNHGYAMSTLFYYFTSPLSKKDGLALDKAKIVEFYQLWDEFPGQGFTPMRQWFHRHKLDFFLYPLEYENYLMCLLSGELISYKKTPFINVFTISSSMKSKYTENITSDGKKDNSFPCLTYGCYIGDYTISNYKNEKGENSLKGKEIVIKQIRPNVTTYVIAGNKSRVKQLPGRAVQGDSIVINGDDLAGMFDGAGVVSLYTVTINCVEGFKKDGEVSFEIRNSHYAYVKPTELKFPAEGGTQTVTVTAKGYKKYNHIIDDEYKSWLSGKNNSAGKLDITAQPNTTGKERVGYVKPYVLIDENSTERVYLTPVKVPQAANEKQGDDTQSEFRIVSGAIHMYYAVAWRHDMSFKAGDEFSTITPKGKGANVKFVQSGRDTGANATWKITVTFDVDDLSLVNVQKAKLSNFKFVYERIQGEYSYYSGHVDYGREDATMESKVSKSQNANGIWYFEAGDLTYHQESMLHYDAWKKDYYSKPEEYTYRSETDVVTDGSYVNISLEVEKKK